MLKRVAKKLHFVLLSLALLVMVTPIAALTGPDCLVACEAGSLQEVRKMLEAHTTQELFRVRDEQGRGLLHYCVKRDQDFWQALLEAGWPVKEEKGWTPQHEASLLGKLSALKALSEKGASLEPVEPLNGGTPLHVAAFNGHFEVVKFLVKSGVKVNARDNDGWTALSQTRDQGFPQIEDWLKKNGATR